MKSIIICVLGVWLFINGVLGLFDGSTIGFGTLAGGGGSITVDDSPIEFYLAIIFQLVGGGYSVKVALFDRNLDED